MTQKDRNGDRLLLGVIAIFALIVLGGVVASVVFAGKELSKEGWGLLGVIAGGLISQPQQVISAIKESWLSMALDRQSDRLHASKPDPESAGLMGMEAERREMPRPTFGREE